MNEPYPGGGYRSPADGPNWGFQSGPGDRPEAHRTDRWPNDDWYRPRRRPELDQTTVDQAVPPDPRRRQAGRDWRPVNLNWALISRNWALLAGLVFFLLDTFVMVDGFARPVAMTSRALVILIWLISLVAVALLWLRGSSRFSIQNPFVRAGTGTHQR